MSNFNDFVIETYLLSCKKEKIVPDINIAFAIDENYLKPCGITIYSITENNKDINIDFHIFTTSFDIIGYQEIIDNNPNIRIHVYILNTFFYDCLQTNGHFTTAIYYRLSIANILQDKLKDFWYLDADILCVDSINDMLSINLENYILAAVQDTSIDLEYVKDIGLNPLDKYFNSGVLYINIDAWNNFQTFEKFSELISKRNYKFPDQDVLNIVLKDQVKFIDQKFNYFSQDKVSPIFIHFVSSPKPWNIAAINNEKYLEYYFKSPWKNTPLTSPKSRKEIKKYAKKLWKNKKYMSSLKWFFKYLTLKI